MQQNLYGLISLLRNRPAQRHGHSEQKSSFSPVECLWFENILDVELPERPCCIRHFHKSLGVAPVFEPKISK
jgi:hypothetical protein